MKIIWMENVHNFRRYINQNVTIHFIACQAITKWYFLFALSLTTLNNLTSHLVKSEHLRVVRRVSIWEFIETYYLFTNVQKWILPPVKFTALLRAQTSREIRGWLGGRLQGVTSPVSCYWQQLQGVCSSHLIL